VLLAPPTRVIFSFLCYRDSHLEIFTNRPIRQRLHQRVATTVRCNGRFFAHNFSKYHKKSDQNLRAYCSKNRTRGTESVAVAVKGVAESFGNWQFQGACHYISRFECCDNGNYSNAANGTAQKPNYLNDERKKESEEPF
jgi:hypothetical protein